jgi:hypothetical protein
MKGGAPTLGHCLACDLLPVGQRPECGALLVEHGPDRGGNLPRGHAPPCRVDLGPVKLAQGVMRGGKGLRPVSA